MRKDMNTAPGNTRNDTHFDCIVIGAGPSGLVTIKELIDQGLSVLALEAQTDLGGVYRTAYDFMRLVTSNNHIFFGSFPHGKESEPVIWDKHGYVDYLKRFANHFSLLPHIRFSSRVDEVRRDEGTVFTVVTEDGSTFTSDKLAVCSGVHQVPKRLAIKGADSFRGEVLHSSDVKGGDAFAGRNVLIVGLGESASDIALEVARYAATTCISSRGGPGFVIPRYYGGTVTDLDTNRCYHSLPYQIFDRWPVKFKVWLERFYASESDDQNVLRRVREFNTADGRPWKMRTSTKSTSFVEAILYHKTQYKRGIAHLEADRVIFEDESEFVCDVVIDCTGFRITFPFLEQLPDQVAKRAERPRALFKHMIIPDVGPDISFVGFVRPAVGAIPPIAEMQARYLALLLSGAKPVPSLDEMNNDIASTTEQDREQFSHHFDTVLPLTDYLRFLDGLASYIGCAPPLRKVFFTDIRLWSKLMFATVSGIHYRLRGPGQDYAAARQTLLKMPTMPAPILAAELLIKVSCQAVALLPWSGLLIGSRSRTAEQAGAKALAHRTGE